MSNWGLASRWGILRDKTADDAGAPWNTGRLFDALRVGRTPGASLLVASDGSGVWIVNETGGPALPLSWDWLQPNVACLAEGIYRDEHVYAGGDVLSETDVTKPVPLFNWRQIAVVGPNREDLNPGFINRIVALRQLQLVVLACDNGVFWASVPPPGGTYIFKQGPQTSGRRFSGLAEGPASTLILGAWGTNLVDHFGISVGTWDSVKSIFSFSKSKISGILPSQMRRVDIASCPTDRNTLYAVCGGGNNIKQNIDPKTLKPVLDPFGNATWVNDDDFILAVLSSKGNGGSVWGPTGTAVTGQTFSLFPGSPSSNLAGHTQNGYVGCVGVSFFDPDHIAIGMTNVFISKNGGGNWVRHSVESNSHLHADTHAVVFDPADAATLHVCSDGGLATTPDLGDGWRSASNRQLPNLEFFDFSPSIVDSGLIAGSLQDNGILYAPLYITTEPWRSLRGGDGEITRFVAMGGLAWQDNEVIGTEKVGVCADFWHASERRFYELPVLTLLAPPSPPGLIFVDGTSRGLPITDSLGFPPKQLISAVNAPAHANAQGELMVAVAAIGLRVHPGS